MGLISPDKNSFSALKLGTSGWSYDGWQGNFYPQYLPQNRWLEFYVQKFNAVEVDSTFYGIPPRERVQRWAELAPAGFEFALKVPQVITHEKSLDGCDAEMNEFLSVVETLGEHLGPVLFQFPYGFKPDRLGNLLDFLDQLPPEPFRYVVEIRNRAWLTSALPAELTARNLPLCTVEHPWMPRTTKMTGDFMYLRFLGDQKKITVFDHTQLDRQKDLTFWAAEADQWLKKNKPVYVFFNNHFAGHAPSDVHAFAELLKMNSRNGR
jgi:uncharacterized protein YecE (DUF72 family)